MGKPAVSIELKEPERRELVSLARAQKTGRALLRRARIVLAAASGLENKAICVQVGADANTVSKWRRRFAERRLDGLLDEPRPGAPRTIGDEDRRDYSPGVGGDAARRHPLVAARDGQSGRLCPPLHRV
jgi:hypothetical protein